MTDNENSDVNTLAQTLRDRLIAAAEQAYEDAGIRGLCEQGRWARALDAMKSLDLSLAGDQDDTRST